MDNESQIIQLLTEIRDDQRAARKESQNYMAQGRGKIMVLMIISGIILGLIIALK